MNTYRITFTGRARGAIGIVHGPIIQHITAEDEEKAILALYDKWEHVSRAKIEKLN